MAVTGADFDGAVIPAVPLLLDDDGRVDWRAQRAVLRYYLDAGITGLAVGVHTTQFELHDDPGLLDEVWALAAELSREHVEGSARHERVLLVAGIAGDDAAADREITRAADLGFDAALMCSPGMATTDPDSLLARARLIGATLPTIGFYLQESVGGVFLPGEFWRALSELESVVAIKAAPFDRYRTRDVARGIAESSRWQEVTLLTGNDDAILADLLTEHRFEVAGETRTVRCRGGLLGQFAVGTRAAVELTGKAHANVSDPELLTVGADLTEVNAAVFDVRHGFAGCVAGVNEVLRQQGIASSSRCLSPRESLSAGQAELISAVRERFRYLCDEEYVAAHREAWLDD